MSDRPLLDTGLFVMDFARKATLGFLEGIKGDAFVQTFTPDGGNAAYVVGHLCFTDDMTLHALAGRESTFTEAEQKLFGGGAEPSKQSADYPSRDELLTRLTDLRTGIIEYFTSLTPSELTAPVEGPMAQFGDTRAKLMPSLAWPEGMHSGQLTVIRRQLALPRVFG